jgi:ubiquinone/menaquinone biosynthesis C-methylase UbiE
MFLCPRCKGVLSSFRPAACRCGHEVPQVESVYRFSADPPIALAHEGRRYLGYDGVGENYEDPGFAAGVESSGDFGIFGACSRKLVEMLGRGCTVLDLGAGLGPAAIPLAMAGARTIAADISQKMLAVAVRRASACRLEGELVFARINAYNLPLADGSLDAVVAVDVLHQLDNPEIAVREILRVLKPGGILAEYGSKGLPITEEQRVINSKCREALRDIERYYRERLIAYGYTGPPFSSWEKVKECLERYFAPPEVLETAADEVWTGAMRKGIHKLATRASGAAQLIPDDIHNAAWRETEAYAVAKYGEDYRNIPGYSRYTGLLKIYRTAR